jgi:hypothetical protein
MVLILVMLNVLGVYVWYQIDRDRAEELLGRQIDSYLSALKEAASGVGNNAGLESLDTLDTADAIEPAPASIPTGIR